MIYLFIEGGAALEKVSIYLMREEVERERETERQTETDRETDRERETKSQKQTDRQRNRQTETDRKSQTPGPISHRSVSHTPVTDTNRSVPLSIHWSNLSQVSEPQATVIDKPIERTYHHPVADRPPGPISHRPVNHKLPTHRQERTYH